MFGHLPLIILLLVVALLFFGPKRMIEMASSAGKALRELRDATKEMNWSSLTAQEPQPRPEPPPVRYGVPFTTPTAEPTAQPPTAAQVIDSTPERRAE